MNDAITFTMRLDASDMRKLFGAGGGGMRGGSPAAQAAAMAGGGGGGGNTQQAQVTAGKNQAQGMAMSPRFMSIFAPLAALKVMSSAIGGILRNSQIANTYGAAMGKIFGAAMDILLVPFLPIFNLILVGMTKLIAWLISSGALQELTKIMQRSAGYIEAIVKWLGQIFGALKNFDLAKLGQLIMQGLIAAIKTLFKDPKGVLGIGAAAAVGVSMVGAMLTPLVLPLMMAGKALSAVAKVAGFGGQMLGIGGGAAGAAGAGGAGAAGAAGAGGAGAAAGGMGLMGMVGVGALAAGGGLAAGVGANYLAGKAGIHGTARNVVAGAAGGAVAGAIVGSVVPVIGTAIGAIAGGLIGGGLGFMKGQMSQGQGQSPAGGGSNNVSNSNNVIYLTQNNTFSSTNGQKDAANQMADALSKKMGFKLSVRGGS